MNRPHPTRTNTRRKGKNGRRKVSVEIYFVLYLSAIILLLGTARNSEDRDSAELEEAIAQLFSPDFRVEAETVALVYSFIPTGVRIDTSGVRLRRDSANVIRAHGSFADADFRIEAIRDTITDQELPVESAVLLRQNDSTVVFRWRPQQTDRNAVYRVTVSASATPLPPRDLERLDPILRTRVMEALKQQGPVRDSVTFSVNVYAVTDPSTLRMAEARPAPTLRPTAENGPPLEGFNSLLGPSLSALSATGGFSQDLGLSPNTPTVYSAPQGIWSNRVNVYGPDAQQFEFTVETDRGSARLAGRTQHWVEITGTAPSNDQQKVVVRLSRPGGPPLGETSFTVQPVRLPSPTLPTVFYEDQTYRLDFTSSQVSDDQIAVEVIENGSKIIDREERLKTIPYRPQAPGKVIFVRYLVGREVGRYSVPIAPLPKPTISNVRRLNDDEVVIETTSHGLYQGRNNYTKLVVDAGNADLKKELVEQRQTDATEYEHKQYWLISRRNNTEPFQFEAWAMDQRGSRASATERRKFSY